MLPDYLQVAIRNYVVGAKVPAARPFLKKNLHALLIRARRDLVTCSGADYHITVLDNKARVVILDELFEIKT